MRPLVMMCLAFFVCAACGSDTTAQTYPTEPCLDSKVLGTGEQPLPCGDGFGCDEEPPPDDGSDGAGSPTVTKTVECFGVVYPYGASTGQAFVKHTIWDCSDGSVRASCFVSFRSADTTANATHATGTYGASVGRCGVENDLDAPSGGRWDFVAGTDRAVTSVTYRDSASHFDGWQNAVTCSVR